jgi:hypothetical protein
VINLNTKGEVNELETNNNNKKFTELYVINVSMNGYRPRTTIINGKNGDSLAVSHCVFNRWWKYFSRLLNTQGFYDVR